MPCGIASHYDFPLISYFSVCTVHGTQKHMNHFFHRSWGNGKYIVIHFMYFSYYTYIYYPQKSEADKVFTCVASKYFYHLASLFIQGIES